MKTKVKQAKSEEIPDAANPKKLPEFLRERIEYLRGLAEAETIAEEEETALLWADKFYPLSQAESDAFFLENLPEQISAKHQCRLADIALRLRLRGNV